MSKPKSVEAVLLGSGYRGYYTFGKYALQHPDQLQYVAVAEPDERLRERFAREHDIDSERCFQSWEDLMVQEQLAPVLFNTTMDTTHFPSTMAALRKGYDVVQEKPLATTPEHCIMLVQEAERQSRNLWVWHEMRYTDFFSKVHQIVQSGQLGDIITVDHRENIASWHYAHSYVRGNWREKESSSPMILSKCCHDFDQLLWILGRRAVRLSSFGSLLHFRSDQIPHQKAPSHCTDGCPVEEECPFYAPRLYTSGPSKLLSRYISPNQSHSSIMEALRTGPYGRCVYRCDNDVVDHQTVNMEFEGGFSVTMVVHGHSHEPSRTMRYDGSRATLQGQFSNNPLLTIHDHRTNNIEQINPGEGGGHGGGDEKMLSAFIHAVRGEGPALLNSAREALESHIMAFAAEESRACSGVVIEMEKYRQKVEGLAETT